MVNYFQMTRADYDALFAPAPSWDIPHTDDEYVQVNNIIAFLNENQNTEQQVGFQGDGSGNFYVKAGSFTDGSDPNIKGTGTLIYDASKNMGSTEANYQSAAHLANVMNYILNKTRGSDYGSATPLFSDTATTQGNNYYTSLDSTTIPKGFYSAYGGGSYFYCHGRGYTGCNGYDDVRSSGTRAIWW